MKDNFYVLWVKVKDELKVVHEKYPAWARKKADDEFGEGNWTEEKMQTRTEWLKEMTRG